MSDTDLEAIRHARLQQLQQSSGGSPQQPSQQDEQKQRESEARTSILSQILEPLAADRLGRIRLVNAQRASEVEERLIGLARSGNLRARVTEEQLKELLAAVAKQHEAQGEEGEGRGPSGVKVVRRGGWDDDDLDDLLDEN